MDDMTDTHLGVLRQENRALRQFTGRHLVVWDGVDMRHAVCGAVIADRPAAACPDCHVPLLFMAMVTEHPERLLIGAEAHGPAHPHLQFVGATGPRNVNFAETPAFQLTIVLPA